MFIDSCYNFYIALNAFRKFSKVLVIVDFIGVKIRIFRMTRNDYDSLLGCCLSRTNVKIFRPQSSKYSSDSRKMPVRHQQSVDYANDHLTEHVLRKRSNSLQSLSSVDHQKNSSKERKINFKPIKIAWTSSRAPSDEKNFKTAFENWKTGTKPVSLDGQVESCLEYKNKQDETSKKKSIDIFLSRNFIDPAELLPSTKGPKLTLKNLGSSFTKHESAEYESVTEYPPPDINFPVITDQDGEKDSETNSIDIKNEKKVTFADTRKMSAETRRMNFRNSYSKRYTNISFSSPRLEKQTSVNKCSTPRIESRNVMKRGNSLTLPETNDERTATSPSPVFKQPVQIDKSNKQFAIKRKLKSCRSKSFHKSFDNSSIIENIDAFTFRKPMKAAQHDVITMVSLIVSNEDQDLEAASKNHTRDNPENTTNKEEKPYHKSEKQPKTTGILKAKWQPENIKRVTTQPLQKKRIVNTSVQKLPDSPEKTRTILSSVNNLNREDNLLVTNFENKSEEINTQVGEESSSEKPFQTVKEQECWSSFRKMTNKGFSVSFDTILRGLLTPTEYRLRKNELLTQET